ncbi:MAG: PEP-CTERM sorting domain-containing protein, partial [Thermoguttaceae bacterium]|nr:PEP-CTERM sorting domain-containing protein [Thermoguttaceae bacterium]
TISLASKAHLGIIHEDGSTKAGSLVIGTLNSSESNSVVRSSGSVNTNKKVYGTVTVGKGDFAGTIIGHLRLVKNTNGTLTLSGINTYAGGTEILGGKIVLTGKGTLGSGAVTIGENGTLEFNVAEGDPKKMTISSTITSAGKITKTGDGTLQLCTAAEGLVNASSFVVSSGRLDMKEYFSGTLEIGDGAEFSPGNSVGTLNVNGTFKADAYSTLIFEQDASGMDSLSASLFEIDPNAEIQLDISALIPGATYDVIVNTSTGGFTSEQDETFWTNLFEDGLPYYMNLSVVDNHIVRMQIDANAVPEPSTWALLALGVAGLLYWRKRS